MLNSPTKATPTYIGDVRTLTRGTDYTVTLNGTDVTNLATISVTERDDYVLVVTGTGSYHGSLSAAFEVCPAGLAVDSEYGKAETGHYYVNMPATGTNTVTLDGNVTSFKVYDNGGKERPYSTGCKGYLILTAPMGNKIHLTGNVATDRSSMNDYLNVYNGTTTEGDPLEIRRRSTNTGVAGTVNVTSRDPKSNSSLLLYFQSSSTETGLDLTATIESWGYPITYRYAENGKNGVTNGNPVAYSVEDETFTLTNPTRTSYTFGGWFADHDLTTPAITTITQGSTGSKTFCAKWTPTFSGGLALADIGGTFTATLDGSSTATLNIPSPITVDAIALSRTFTVDKPATVMLPFGMDVSNISGATFYTFGGVNKDSNDKWIATMNEATGTLTANTPYLVVPTKTASARRMARSTRGRANSTLTTAAGTCLAAPASAVSHRRRVCISTMAARS